MFNRNNTGLIIGVALAIAAGAINYFVVTTSCFECGWTGLEYCQFRSDPICAYIQSSIWLSLLHTPYIFTSLMLGNLGIPSGVHLLIFTTTLSFLFGLLGNLIQGLIVNKS